MKRFLIKSLVFFLLFSATIALLHSVFFHTALNQNYLLKYKIELLEKARDVSPKIVIIGGSNASFAFRSFEMERALGCRVVNASVNIHEGLAFYLKLSGPYLNVGDLLLMCPEYGNLDGDTFYGSNKLILNAYTYPGFYGMLAANPAALANFLTNTPGHVENFLDFVFHLKFFKDRKKFETEVLTNYNWHGDWSRYEDEPSFAGFPITVREPKSAHVRYVAEQVRALEERGVRCLWIYPATRKGNLQLGCDLETYDHIVRAIPGLTVLAAPQKSIYDDHLFYDSPYHLNEAASRSHTAFVVTLLRSFIDISPQT